MSDEVPFTEEELHDLYLWVDTIPITRPKKNIARDFSDGCCVAEILHHFFPKMVELHNYVPSMSRARKINNWETLNARVLGKIYFTVPRDEIEDLTAAVPGAIERFLRALRIKITQIKAHQATLQNLPQDQRPAPPSARRSPRGVPPTTTATGAAASGKAARPQAESSAARGASGSGRGTASGAAASKAVVSGPRKESLTPSSRGSGSHGLRGGRQHRDPSGGQLLEEDGALGELLLDEKTRTIAELKETVAILTEKIMKLEELLQIKDGKLNQYREKFGRM